MPSSCTKDSSSSTNKKDDPNDPQTSQNEQTPDLRRRKSATAREVDGLSEEDRANYDEALAAINEENHEELIKCLRAWPSKLKKNSLGRLLWGACESDLGVELVKSIIDYGANVNFASQREQCANCLMLATQNNSLKLVELLVDSGAKVNAADKFGWTPLFYASYFGHVDCAKWLLDHGANMNQCDTDAMSCLLWAAGRGQLALVELLLSRGANVNSLDRYNSSALLWASRGGHIRIVACLLQKGANINKQGMYGWSPLIAAVKGDRRETTNLLLKSKQIDLSLCDGGHMNALMIACAELHEQIALDLIQHLRHNFPGSSSAFIINQVNSEGQNALILAAKSKCPKLVLALLAAGACFEQVGRDGRSALDWAVHTDDNESYRALSAMRRFCHKLD